MRGQITQSGYGDLSRKSPQMNFGQGWEKGGGRLGLGRDRIHVLVDHDPGSEAVGRTAADGATARRMLHAQAYLQMILRLYEEGGRIVRRENPVLAPVFHFPAHRSFRGSA